jgi:Zn finger protein HypA/HybF involved in hydrogenase expression
VDGLVLLKGSGLTTLKQLSDHHVSQVKQLFTAIGHAFVINQVRVELSFKKLKGTSPWFCCNILLEVFGRDY